MVDQIINAIAGGISDLIPAAGEPLLGSLTAGDIAAGGLVGAGLGAGGAALTGGNIGAGALTGGLAGGLIPVGGAAASELGISPTVGEALLGAGGGALGGVLTGTSPLTGALAGGGAGLAAGLTGSVPGTAPTAAGIGAVVPGSDTALGQYASADTSKFGMGLSPPSGGAVQVPQSVPATPAAGGGGFLSSLTKNPGLLLGGLGLGASALKGNQIPELGPIQNLASQLAKEGQVLRQSITTGKLPPGAQSAVDEAVKANQAQIRSEFAAMGMPYGSTMETTALNEAALRGTQMAFQIAQQMFNAGMQATNLSSGLLTTIANAQLSSDEALSKSIANFAAALAGGGLKTS